MLPFLIGTLILQSIARQKIGVTILDKKKEVEVTYFDGSLTVDEIMKALNDKTSANDTVRLVDGTSVGKKEPTVKYDDLSGGIYRMMKAVSEERIEFLTKHPENALVPCQTNLAKVMSEKENVSQENVGNSTRLNPQRSSNLPQALYDSSNQDRRVSFAPIQNNLPRPVMTPRPSNPVNNYQVPYAYNYLTATQSPVGPYNSSSYHGYGMSVPVNGYNGANTAHYPYQLYPHGSPYGTMQSPSRREYIENGKRNSGVKE